MTKVRQPLMAANNDEIPPLTPTEILTTIKTINTTNSRKPLRDQALVALLYLSGARCSEICKFIDKKALEARTRPLDQTGNQPLPYHHALRKSDIEWFDDGFDIHHIRTLKQRGKKLTTREVPVIPTTPDEKDLMDLFKSYYDTIPDCIPDPQWEPNSDKKQQLVSPPLFDITRQRAWKIINQRLAQFPHRLRHSAASQDSKIGLNNAELRKRYGWTDERTPGNYTKTNTEEIKKKYREKRRY